MIIICGIVGFYSGSVTTDDLEILKKVMIESRIRGMHASGIAWYDGNSIQSIIKPIAIDKLVNQIDLLTMIYHYRPNKTNKTGEMSLIAHARYSTSNIEYNQPIIGKSMAVVHNGVISQEPPEMWENLYGYKCCTKNDSELILKAKEQNDNILTKFPNASISAITLDNTGTLTYIRNAQRPLWYGKIGKGIIFASTYDILRRAGVTNINKIKTFENKELQRRDWTQWEKHKLIMTT